MADTQELEKNTKYLLLFAVLLILVGIFFVVRGFLRPWLNRVADPYQSPKIEISEDSLRSTDLTNLIQFYHIAYPEEEIGRRDLFEKPELSDE